MIRKGFEYYIVLALAGVCASGGTPSKPAGSITGRVVDQDGGAIEGAQVIYRRTPARVVAPQPGAGFQVLSEDAVGDVGGIAVTDARGRFQAGPLPNGGYTICVEFPAGNFLSTCRWGSGRVVMLSGQARQSVVNVIAHRAAVVEIRIYDPAGVLPLPIMPDAPPGLTVGVFAEDGSYVAAKTSAIDQNGRVMQVSVPSGVPLKLHVDSRHVKFTLDRDGANTAVAGGVGPFQVTQPAERTRFSVNVTGRAATP
jgi:hypothetical protein